MSRCTNVPIKVAGDCILKHYNVMVFIVVFREPMSITFLTTALLWWFLFLVTIIALLLIMTLLCFYCVVPVKCFITNYYIVW